MEDVLGGPNKPGYLGVASISDKDVLDHSNHPVLLAEAISTAWANHKAWELPKDFPYAGQAPQPYTDRLTPVRLQVVKRLIPKTSATAQTSEAAGLLSVPRINGTNVLVRKDVLTATDLLRAFVAETTVNGEAARVAQFYLSTMKFKEHET